MWKRAFFFCAFMGIMSGSTFAHQPILIIEHTTKVFDPEISKAYYAKLSGQPDHFSISSETSFILYVNILTPYNEKTTNSVSASVLRTSDRKLIARLDGEHFRWKKFFEPFGHDDYWIGPEFRDFVPAGEYEVIVSSPLNQEKYALAIGEKESFTLPDIYNVVVVVPNIKRLFFEKSPIDFLLSIVGATYFIFILVLSASGVFLLRRWLFVRPASLQLMRWIALTIGLTSLLATMLSTWHPLLMFLSFSLIFVGLFLRVRRSVDAT